MKNNKFEVNNLNDESAELLIYGIVGRYWEELSAKDIISAIRKIDAKNIIVKIHSDGGSVFAGLAIYNAHVDHSALITVRVDSLAASIASVIAMAGDRVEMPENAFLMIHNPYVYASGDEKEMAKAAEFLGKIKKSLISVYTKKTGLDAAELSTMMDDETWLMAQEAVDMGFADVVIDAMPVQNMVALNQLKGFRNVPASIKKAAVDNFIEAGSKESSNQIDSIVKGKKEKEKMDIETLKKDHPEIAKALIEEGHQVGIKEGAKNELDRIKAVQGQAMPGHEDLVNDLAFDGMTTGPEGSFAF